MKREKLYRAGREAKTLTEWAQDHRCQEGSALLTDLFRGMSFDEAMLFWKARFDWEQKSPLVESAESVEPETVPDRPIQDPGKTRDRRRDPVFKSYTPRTLSALVTNLKLDEVGSAEVDEALSQRPKIRGECTHRRPCPWVGCRHHLWLEVSPAGSVKLLFGCAELDDLPDTCALDAAERGGLTLREVGRRLNITRERARQIEWWALLKMFLILYDDY